MKCPRCNGSGEIKHDWLPNEKCHNCGGCGYVNMTNEEYIRSLNTEQLAKFIFWQHFDVYGKTLYELMVNASKGVSRDKQAEVMIGAVVEWLKQPHTSLKNDEK